MNTPLPENTSLRSTPAVSVIIPVYNVADYLPETLDSICAQSFTNWECLCVDDGSTDESARIVREYAARDARFRLLSQANAGAAAARNRGIEEAQGTYLLFVDADDLVLPALMETCVKHMNHDLSDLCAFEAETFCNASDTTETKCALVPLDEGISHAVVSPYDQPDDILLQICVAPWNKMYKLEFLRKNGLRFPTTLKRSEDTSFGTLCLALASHISCVKATLYLYRQNRPDSQMNNLEKPSVYYCYIDAAEVIWKELRSRGLLKSFGVGALRLSLGNSIYYHEFLKEGPRMWLATRRLRRFMKQSLRELRKLGVHVPPNRLAEIKGLMDAFAHHSRKKCRHWLFNTLQVGLFSGKKSNRT